MKARQSVTHPFSFPMEAGRRGGSKEANLVEWPLKQQSAVNMLWCHAPNAHRAYCPKRRERTFAPVSHFAKWPRAGGVSLQTKSGGGGVALQGFEQWWAAVGHWFGAAADGELNSAVTRVCFLFFVLNHGRRSCLLWLSDEEEEEERLTSPLCSVQVWENRDADFWPNVRLPRRCRAGFNVRSVQVHQDLSGRDQSRHHGIHLHMASHLRLFRLQTADKDTGNVCAHITDWNWPIDAAACTMISGELSELCNGFIPFAARALQPPWMMANWAQWCRAKSTWIYCSLLSWLPCDFLRMFNCFFF